MNIYLEVADKFGFVVDSNLMDAIDNSGVTEQEWKNDNKGAREKIMEALNAQTNKMIAEEMTKPTNMQVLFDLIQQMGGKLK